MADQVLQEIKDRLNLAEVIAGYIPVKKAGGSFKAVCPFHSEKTPSLMISAQKQIWHCFGCGEGGDVLGFVMRYENLGFRQALEMLAEKAGVRLPEFRMRDQKTEDEKDLLLRINDFAARFYHQILTKDKRGAGALEYLKNRGLAQATIQKWQIGFAPDDFHVLEKALMAKKVGLEQLVRAGVSSKNERGQIYDRFRGRVTFPIFNGNGEVAGFSARILDDAAKAAKYINSPQTPIYNKSSVLFGLNFAKNEIRRRDEAVVVEGQMDCISAHQAGFGNVVASSGTALTEQQLAALGRLTKNLKFCFDADAAGLLATKRAISLYLGKDFTIKIIRLSGGKDPDEIIRKDPGLWAGLVQDAPLFLDYFLERSFEGFWQQSVEQKKAVARELLPLIASLTDPVEQDHYLKILADKFNTGEKALRDALAKIAAPHPAAALPSKSAAAKIMNPETRQHILEKEVLGALLYYPALLEEFRQKGEAADFEDSEARHLAELLLAGEAKEQDKSSALAKEALFMVESQLETLQGSEQVQERELKKSIILLSLASIKRRQAKLNWELKKAEESEDRAALEVLRQKTALLIVKRAELEKAG